MAAAWRLRGQTAISACWLLTRHRPDVIRADQHYGPDCCAHSTAPVCSRTRLVLCAVWTGVLCGRARCGDGDRGRVVSARRCPLHSQKMRTTQSRHGERCWIHSVLVHVTAASHEPGILGAGSWRTGVWIASRRALARYRKALAAGANSMAVLDPPCRRARQRAASGGTADSPWRVVPVAVRAAVQHKQA